LDDVRDLRIPSSGAKGAAHEHAAPRRHTARESSRRRGR
jgi:hypothetical protein